MKSRSSWFLRLEDDFNVFVRTISGTYVLFFKFKLLLLLNNCVVAGVGCAISYVGSYYLLYMESSLPTDPAQLLLLETGVVGAAG
jgi:hypothetical protein